MSNSTGLTVVPADTIRRLLKGKERVVLDIVRDAYLTHGSGNTSSAVSLFVYPKHPPRARTIAMPIAMGGNAPLIGIKWISGYPSNVEAGYQRASGVIILNSADTGFPVACLEAAVISATRTAASAALFVQYCLDSGLEFSSVGYIGTGVIANALDDYMVALGVSPKVVYVYDPVASRAIRFSERLRMRGRQQSVVCSDVASAIGASDLVIIASTATEPHIHDLALFSHRPAVVHLSLRDIDPAVLLECTNFVDDRVHALKEGTSLGIAARSKDPAELIQGDASDMISRSVTPDRDRPIVYSPFGLAALDIAVADYVLRQAPGQAGVVEIPEFCDGRG